RQKAGQRDYGKAEDRQRDGEPLMPLDGEVAVVRRVEIPRRKEQFADKALLSLPEPHDGCVAQHRQVEGVTLEGQDRQFSARPLVALPVAVDQDDARALRRVGEGATPGEDPDRLLRVAPVMYPD